MILTVDKQLMSASRVDPTSFNAEGIWERKHIQEWFRRNPELLGEKLLIVSMEFDKFEGADDRLDLLALDLNGNLVVVEFKRDPHAGYADLQALRYAAMVSSMTLETLIPYFNEYRRKHESLPALNDAEVIGYFQEFVEADDFKELSTRPRVILCSQDFNAAITTTVLWLNDNGLDLSCVRITPYKVGEQFVIVPNRIIPIPEAEQYLIDIRKKEEPEATGRKKYRGRSMPKLLESGVLKEGDKLYLKKELPSYVKFKEGDPYYTATITGKHGQKNAVRWDYDGQEYSISGLTWKIFADQNPRKDYAGAVNGNAHWANSAGEALYDLAEKEFMATTEAPH